MTDPIQNQKQREEIITRKTAVLLMAHGGPDSLDDIEPFLCHIMKGRVPSPEIIAVVKDRYRQIGGASPLLEITRQQAQALEKDLNRKEDAFRVYVGMRHFPPYIKDTLSEILKMNPSHLVAISMAPQHSRMSVDAYIETARTAIADLHADSLPISFVKNWHNQPLLLDAFAKKIKKRLLEYPEDIRSQVLVVFTAHSLPEKIREEGDLYPIHMEETMNGIVKRLGALLAPEQITFAYQSRGMSGGTWLGPDIEDVIKSKKASSMLVAPIGFVADHVEILYDIDILYKQIAKENGITLDRIESLNTAPLFIAALASVVHAHLPL
ncbi:MAG: ferrochelatase [Nitrospirota bacterium]